MSYDSAASLTADILNALAEVGEAVHVNLPLDALLSRLTQAFSSLLPCDALGIALSDVHQQSITLRAYADGQGQVLEKHVGQSVSILDLPLAQTLITNQTLVHIPNTSLSSLWNGKNGSLFLPDTLAFLGAPLTLDNHVRGFLFFEFRTVFELTDSVRCIVDACTRYAVAAIRNAQEREELTRSEQRYRLAVSLTSDAVYEQIVGEIKVDWSGDVDAFLNYSKGAFERTESSWLAAIHPHDRKRYELARELLVNKGIPFQEEYRMRQATGSYCYVLDRAVKIQNITPGRILGVITDLSNTYELTDALVESEVRYRTLFTSALDAIFVTDSSGGLLNFNPATEALTGREYRELASATLHDLVPPQNISDYMNILDQLRVQGEISNFDMRFRRPDNTVVNTEMWGTALGGGMYQFMARDVSVRQQTQVLAAQRIAELTALSEVTTATTAGGEVIDILHRVLPGAMNALEMPIGRIYLCDRPDRVLHLVAFNGTEVLKDALPESMPIEAADTGRITQFSQLVRIVENNPGQGEVLYSLQVPLISNTNVLGLMIFSDTKPRTFLSTEIYLLDIIGRQLSIGVENVRLLDNLEQLVQERTVALFSTETRYKSLIEQVPGVVYTADTPYSDLSFISSGTEGLFGLTSSEVMEGNNSLLICVKPEDLLWVSEYAAAAMVNGQDFDQQYRVINVQTSKEAWVHHHARLIMAGTGETFWLGLITDVTNLKELDNLKSQFVATVTHELRTPLSAIKLRAATLNNYYHRLTDDQRLEMVDRIRYQSDILAQLIEDVLRLAKLDDGNVDRQIENVDLAATGMEILEELRPSDGNAPELKAIWEPERKMIRADPSDIARIWRNLISNAIKYTPSTGEVNVCTALVRTDSQGHMVSSTLRLDYHLAVPGSIAPGSWLVGVVQDTGKGISPLDQEHIFTRFYRGEAAYTNIPGTGLGLSLVKELVAEYSGHITLRSSVGAGSTFAFWLPTINNE